MRHGIREVTEPLMASPRNRERACRAGGADEHPTSPNLVPVELDPLLGPNRQQGKVLCERRCAASARPQPLGLARIPDEGGHRWSSVALGGK